MTGFMTLAGMLFQRLSSHGQGELPFSFSLPILSSRYMNIITQHFHTTDVCGSKYPWFLMQTGSTEGGKLQSICQENSREIYLTLLILNQKEGDGI
ncbi:hypothetical protein V6N11_080280 [Hibiscus sabdariffa]|uniref:Uncharacterized protein n=1 Tax=Hibiscus sabdariffa TaxID=183260 RepID=A0ABR2R785_9ROSI